VAVPKYLNRFESMKYVEQTILDNKGKKLGTIRIKPSGVGWKPGGTQTFISVPLADFVSWITGAPSAKKTKS
jgi:hypothetical protein